MNLVIITSVINISDKPFSYSNIRSYCDNKKRFNDTIKTIESIKKYIKDCKIFLIECSNISDEYTNFFIKNTDYFINLYNNKNIVERCNNLSKSMGEGTMTIEALKYINDNKIYYENLFKISGRYWFNDIFDYSFYNNENIVVKKIENNINNIFTCFYKLPKNIINKFYNFLLNSENDFINCIGYEIIFAKFINSFSEEILFIPEKIGINGYVSVCGSFIDM
jgi:hypothetical protein